MPEEHLNVVLPYCATVERSAFDTESRCENLITSPKKFIRFLGNFLLTKTGYLVNPPKKDNQPLLR